MGMPRQRERQVVAEKQFVAKEVAFGAAAEV